MIEVPVPLEQDGTEAVVTSWLCRPGARVQANDPLVEIETDKVSLEVPAPASGIVDEILIPERGIARPGMVLARIRAEDVAQTAPPVPEMPAAEPDRPATAGRAMAGWHSPAVRKLLAETGIDPAGIRGSGRDGRLTVGDLRRAVGDGPADIPTPAGLLTGRKVPHDAMRLAIARNMLRSVQEAPQVTAVFEADFTAVAAHRARHRDSFAAEGIALSWTPYLLAAAARAMQAVPVANARWHEDHLEVFTDVNIGVGTALGDKGLVVPVIRRVQDLSLRGIAHALQEVTARARAGRLVPGDMQGGTFTLSNHGVSGSLLAAPVILNPPQVAILGVGRLEKRVVVREVAGQDTIQIRPMAYVSLTIDHRALDGHQTNAWLTAFVAALEGYSD